MDRRLIWKNHIQDKCNQAIGKYEQLRPVLGARSKLSLKNKTRIYKAIISPTMTYVAAAWCFAATSNLQKLQITQNKILRRMTGMPWFVRNVDITDDLNIRPITQTIKELARKTYDKAENHTNQTILDAIDYTADTIIRHRRPRMGM